MRKSSVVGAFVRWLAVRVAPVAIGVVLAAAPAVAQPGGRGGARDFARPGVTTEEIEHIGEMLGFSEDQLLVAEQLHAAYMLELDTLGQEFQGVMEGAREEFRESRDPTVWRDFGEVMQKFQDRKASLTDGLLQDVRLVLTPSQDERWVEAERYHRRFSTLGDEGLISGEGVDLIEAVKGLDLDDQARASIEPVLSQYEIDLDRALVERNKAYADGLRRGPAMFFGGGDEGELEKMFEEAKAAAIRLRDVNRRYARQVMTSLDPETGVELQREIDKRSFPRVYRESHGERAFATVNEMDDLSADQRERLGTMEASFRRELEAANRKIAEAIEKEELGRTVESMMPRRGWRGGRDESSDLRDARDAKRELVETWVERLRETLTEAQRARLPEREGENSDWRDRGWVDG